MSSMGAEPPRRNGLAGPIHHAGGLVGEVIESSTTELLVQALQLDNAPPFGSFVEAAGEEGLTVVGVVAHVQTAGIDPGARAIMRGHDDVRDDRIYQENPDLPLVLRTTFRAAIVGFLDGLSSYHQFLPPRPPRLHYSVFALDTASVRAFTDSGLDYFGTLLAAGDLPVDELLAANIRVTAAQRGDPDRFLQAAGRELAQLLRADYTRLIAILRRCIDPLDSGVLSG